MILARQVDSMNRVSISVWLAALLLAACGGGSSPEPATDAAMPMASLKPDVGSTAKPGGPVTITHRIIGNPIVGQPVAIEIEFKSNIGPQAMTVSYRVNDATALQFPETQLMSVSMAPFDDDERGSQQVTVIPLREGRLYLNVSASIETNSGSVSSVSAIPLQVGGALREPQSNGEPGIDSNGEGIISLPARED